MMTTWTDTHCHIYSNEFNSDRGEVLKRAVDAGIGKIFMPNVDSRSMDAMFEAEVKYPGVCIPMMGLHPCSVKADFQQELYQVEQWLLRRSFCAIGEMGTDLYWDKTYWEQQKEAFVIQVNWAKKYRLPIVIHCRSSMDETLDLLEPLCDGILTGIFHCFSGTVDQAKRIQSLGFYVGIGGVATFKNGGLDKVLPGIPLDRIVLETDSPYLAPVPHRGKRNEPSYIPLIAEKLVSFLPVSLDQLRELTTANSGRIFRQP